MQTANISQSVPSRSEDGRPRPRPPRLPPRIIALINMERRLFSSRLQKAESSAFVFFFYPLLLCVRPSRSPLSSRCKDESLRTDASSHSHNQRELLIHSHVNDSCTGSHFSNHTCSYVRMHRRNALSNFVVLLYNGNKEFYSIVFYCILLYSGWPLSSLHLCLHIRR